MDQTLRKSVKAAEAFDAVGIYEEEQVDKTQDYSMNPGQEYLLSYDTDNSDPATLYMTAVTGTNFTSLSTTVMKGKASVTDDGSAAVFVSGDSKIRYISLDPLKPETILSDDAFWDNVAISKDGNRLLLSRQRSMPQFMFMISYQKNGYSLNYTILLQASLTQMQVVFCMPMRLSLISPENILFTTPVMC